MSIKLKKEGSLSRFLSLTVLGAWCVSGLSVLQAANDPNKPNFLFIISDQFRYDLIRSVQDELPRYNGKTKIRTPNLDRLRREGVYFRNAYTQCSVCGPTRSTFRTGNTIERHGQQANDLYKEAVYKLNSQFQKKIEANVTFDQILVSKRGYVAEHFGKWHMPRIYSFATNKTTQIMRYNDAKFTAMTNDTDYAHIIYSFKNADKPYDYYVRLAEVAAGLSKTELPGMQKDTYSRFPYVADAIDVRYGLPPYTANNPLTGTKVGEPDQQGRATLPSNRTPSYFEGSASIGALDRLARGSQPFVLTASFHNPHAPMVATGLYYDYYKGLESGMFIPPSLSGADMANSGWSKMSDPDYQNSAKVKEWMVSYYALCEEVDHYVGLLLNKLDEYNIADNTMVVFVSDHGEMLGAHGKRDKSTFLEESAHVPLLMRFPGRVTPGTVVEESVATLDCFATTLDYLGAGAYDVSDGRSLRRFIEKKNYNATFDDEAIVTEWDFRTPTNSTALERTLGREVNFLCKKGPWKLMMTKKASSALRDMLYNIETDPYETYNYIGTNGMKASEAAIGKAEHLKCLLMEWMQRMDGGTNKYYSDPKWNYGEGAGDLAEIKARRKWKTLNIWVSDTEVKVGQPVSVSGQLTRNEYIYLGRTTSGTLTVSNITVQGANAGLFQLSEFTSGTITSGNYKRVKLTYRPPSASQTVTDARIVIRHSAGADKVITLSAESGPAAAGCHIDTPTGNVIKNLGDTLAVTVSAFDPDGIERVKIYLNGSAIMSDSSAPYSLNMPLTNAGTFTLTAKVKDVNGNYTDSDNSRTITVNGGTTTTTVPWVTNLTLSAAGTAITNAGLVVGSVASNYSSTVAAGKIFSQTPGGGTTVNRGSSVALAVSLGPQSSSVTLLNEGFEGDFSVNWATIENWKTNTTYKVSGSRSALADVNANNIYGKSLNTAAYSKITISLWYRDDDIDAADDVCLYLYDGSAYVNVFEMDSTTEDTWLSKTLTYTKATDPQYFTTNFKLRVRGNSIDAGENLWIDDVKVVAE